MSNKLIAQQLMERLDQRDVNGVLSYCSPDCVWHGFGPQPLNNDGYRQAIGVFLNAFPDSRFPVEVFVVWLVSGSLLFVLQFVSALFSAIPGVGFAWLPVHYGLLVFVVEPVTALWWVGLYRALSPPVPTPVIA